MKILADQNIPLVNEFFSPFGEVIRLPGREITASDCYDVDILLVRSITNVNKQLLENSRVKFVGSCTIGTDHIDSDFLDENNIVWSNAPGCNANAVVQYVFSAMALLKEDWQEKNIGIIGCGNIGSRLYKYLKKLDVDCSYYDPLLPDANNPDSVSFTEILQSDIITCHTPITKTGPYPTYHLIGDKELDYLKDDALLINSGRGAVIDNKALLAQLQYRKKLKVVLDVWEGEPAINEQLMNQVSLATPHIAGYSLEGKEQGTYVVYQAFQRFLIDNSIQESVNKESNESNEGHLLLNQEKRTLELPSSLLNSSESNAFNQLLLHCYDISRDHQALRSYPSYDESKQTLAQHFDNLRKNYPQRREYTHFLLPEVIKNTRLGSWFTTVSGRE